MSRSLAFWDESSFAEVSSPAIVFVVSFVMYVFQCLKVLLSVDVDVDIPTFRGPRSL